MRPPDITATRSEMAIASAWSWVTSTVVMPEAELQPADLGANLDPQVGVEVRERLVKQQHHRLLDQRTCQRHSLALPARQLVRPTTQQLADADERRDLLDVGLGLLALHVGGVERKADVLAHRQVRVDGVVLEHVADAALLGRDAGDVDAVEQHPSGLRLR